MLLRKINAAFSLIVSFLVLDHAIFLSVWMLSGGGIEKTMNYMPWIMTGLTVIHALISIDLGVSAHRGLPKQKVNSYSRLNAPTIIQRMSGILMLVFTALHVTGAAGLMTPPTAVHMVVPPLFFAIVLVHVGISVSKAFITLGIGSARFVRVFDVVVKIVCALTLVAATVGFYLNQC